MSTTVTSRTSNSIKNTKVSLVFFVLQLLITFVSRKVFLDYLGAEILGLNSTATNLIGLLNLTELGIGTAISATLYKPLYEEDRTTIREIISVQGWLYKNIAIIVTIGGAILMCFFPWIFEKTALPLWYAYATFTVLLFSSLLGYFFNYKQIILSADQKQYKITYVTKSLLILKSILQILLIKYSQYGYQAWLVLEFLFSIVTAIGLQWIVHKNYDWLKTSTKLGHAVKANYQIIITKTKQLFFHKIAGYILQQTSPLVIYAYTSLTIVALYGNYMLISMGLITLLGAIFNGIVPGLGNLISENNNNSVVSVFFEYLSIRMVISGIICYTFWISGHAFIKLWIGDQYFLDNTSFTLIVIYTFISTTRVSDEFLMAYGLFKDIWAPITEATLNLGLSIILGYFFGLLGILSGVLISLFFIVLIWKPYFLCSQALKISAINYYKRYIFYILLLIISGITTHFILGSVIREQVSTIYFLSMSVKHMITYGSIVYGISFLSDRGIRNFTNRIINFIKK